MIYTYVPSGVCSRSIVINIEDNTINGITISGGCNGNSKGVSALLKGMNVDEAINRLSGITCGMRSTSCPDQIAKALLKFKEENEH